MQNVPSLKRQNFSELIRNITVLKKAEGIDPKFRKRQILSKIPKSTDSSESVLVLVDLLVLINLNTLIYF